MFLLDYQISMNKRKSKEKVIFPAQPRYFRKPIDFKVIDQSIGYPHVRKRLAFYVLHTIFYPSGPH